jgi:Putative transposase
MTLPTREFIRRFLTHVLPKGLHRIRSKSATMGTSPEAPDEIYIAEMDFGLRRRAAPAINESPDH